MPFTIKRTPCIIIATGNRRRVKYKLCNTWDDTKLFYDDLLDSKELKERVLANKNDFNARFWGSLVNRYWISPKGEAYILSWRVAEGLIQDLEGHQDNMWYMSAPAGRLDDEVVELLKDMSWTVPHGTEWIVKQVNPVK